VSTVRRGLPKLRLTGVFELLIERSFSLGRNCRLDKVEIKKEIESG